MKKGKVVLLPMIVVAILCVVAIVVGLIFAMRPTAPESKKAESLFNFSTVEEASKKGATLDLSGNYLLSDAEAFGYKGVAEFKTKDKTIASITFDVVLLESDSIKITEAEDAVKDFVKAYSEQFKFPIQETPIKIQFADDETYKCCPSHDYEALIKGYVLFEYSYRDTDGMIWVVQIYSPKDNMLSATVNKYLDMSGFVGYEPQINLQKEVME